MQQTERKQRQLAYTGWLGWAELVPARHRATLRKSVGAATLSRQRRRKLAQFWQKADFRFIEDKLAKARLPEESSRKPLFAELSRGRGGKFVISRSSVRARLPAPPFSMRVSEDLPSVARGRALQFVLHFECASTLSSRFTRRSTVAAPSAFW